MNSMPASTGGRCSACPTSSACGCAPNGELDLEFRLIAITANDVRSGRLTTHDVNTRDVNFARYCEECLREGIDPHTAVEAEALRPGLLRQRLDETIEGLVDDVVRQWNIEARTEEAEREILDKPPAADENQ
ncbi:hypothetical protein ABZ642_28135 [Streptomyces sp. NPDC007157]|uniref:hypothetical protein n=1 Tax=Streptomyces sp. NPDC007157 TaxID=3154681 RepID=UPI00340F912B